jgi:hypothetical protein
MNFTQRRQDAKFYKIACRRGLVVRAKQNQTHGLQARASREKFYKIS